MHRVIKTITLQCRGPKDTDWSTLRSWNAYNTTKPEEYAKARKTLRKSQEQWMLSGVFFDHSFRIVED